MKDLFFFCALMTLSAPSYAGNPRFSTPVAIECLNESPRQGEPVSIDVVLMPVSQGPDLTIVHTPATTIFLQESYVRADFDGTRTTYTLPLRGTTSLVLWQEGLRFDGQLIRRSEGATWRHDLSCALRPVEQPDYEGQ
jgi:hypothetical protein